jgi:hypothetical protein
MSVLTLADRIKGEDSEDMAWTTIPKCLINHLLPERKVHAHEASR